MTMTEEKHGNLSGCLRISSQHISWIWNGNSHRNQIRWLRCVLTDQWRDNTQLFLGTFKHKEDCVVYLPSVDIVSMH